ncbi:3'-5' exonuclease [Acinetobacter baumannii]|uniref:3'-5' exonuclease n=1 Tax=Acinetobacter baumannii TaxID=470 RepID=UPI000A382AAD|nr:3'-5' exonuclease [Acinetobacter baumannii]ELN8901125.1 3'-5' exonuclease [Acinetobacter baumannii]ELT0785583.1 3'-5' exonuclease [Acinetobacter baumannii]OTT70601.1 DNA polymerase III subunit epsilon [Acinetobacter baumannii]
MIPKKEIFISVDVETSGPIPSMYDLLSIGACIIDKPNETFYCELKPVSNNADPEALAVTGFSLEKLAQDGLSPVLAMKEFDIWINIHIKENEIPVFVGFNVGFDWSFINYYFIKYLGRNTFGFTSLDIKSLYMGRFGGSWSNTKSSKILERLNPSIVSNHNALQDALFQAELFRLILNSSLS